MAVLTVCCEPLSSANSLVTGKRTGNFVILRGQSAFWCHIIPPVQWLAKKFPRIRNREIIQPNREFERPDQGFEMSKFARVFRHPGPSNNWLPMRESYAKMVNRMICVRVDSEPVLVILRAGELRFGDI